MAEVLLSSEKRIKNTTSCSDNVAGKYILMGLRVAQEVGLREIVGDCLLEKLKEVPGMTPEEKADPANVPYVDLLNRAQDYLAWRALVEVCNIVTYKVGNFGVSKSTDENLQVADQEDTAKQQFYYQAMADSACRVLQKWIRANRSSYPELKGCDCSANAELTSSASSPFFLGGARGKILPGGGGCCK